MIDLYHHGSSVCAAKVRFALGEKNLKWQGHYLDILKGDQFSPEYRKLNPKAVVPTLVVPGSGLVKAEAEKEGLDKIFKAAGFDWREPGCSMCLAMNADKLAPGERCASTSNRNFEGRQGFKGRTHLVSPAIAAAAAIAGHFVDIRQWG